MIKWKALKCKPSANCVCAVPLIDGLGYWRLLALITRMCTAYWWVGPCNAVRDRVSLSLSKAVVSAKSPFYFLAHVPLKLLVSLISRLVACSARIVVDRQTHRTTTVTLAAHARRGLINHSNDITNHLLITQKVMQAYLCTHSAYLLSPLLGEVQPISICY